LREFRHTYEALSEIAGGLFFSVLEAHARVITRGLVIWGGVRGAEGNLLRVVWGCREGEHETRPYRAVL
jgi:hypothetical protein